MLVEGKRSRQIVCFRIYDLTLSFKFVPIPASRTQNSQNIHLVAMVCPPPSLCSPHAALASSSAASAPPWWYVKWHSGPREIVGVCLWVVWQLSAEVCCAFGVLSGEGGARLTSAARRSRTHTTQSFSLPFAADQALLCDRDLVAKDQKGAGTAHLALSCCIVA
jgi:hypothetical protein